jgi:hypothetical protein
MIVAHPVQKRRVPRNVLRLCGSVRREGKTSCPAGQILAATRQALRLNDCLAWLVPRRKTRARRGQLFWRLIGDNGTRFQRDDRGEDHVESSGFEHDAIQCGRNLLVAAATRKFPRQAYRLPIGGLTIIF